jgi:hypothetical protein
VSCSAGEIWEFGSQRFSLYGTWKQANYVTVAIADDGSLAIAYVPGLRTVTVDFGQMTGAVTARWFDPAGGRLRKISEISFDNKGKRELTPPGRNTDGDEDWVLLLHVE